MIESAKVTFSRIGVHSLEKHVTILKNGVHSSEGTHSVMYMPRIVLNIQGRKSAKVGYLFPDRFKKKDYRGLCVSKDFIAIITTNEVITVDEKTVEEHKAVSISEVGTVIGVQEEGFLSRKGNLLQLWNVECEIIAQRELTAEEIAQLDARDR